MARPTGLLRDGPRPVSTLILTLKTQSLLNLKKLYYSSQNQKYWTKIRAFDTCLKPTVWNSVKLELDKKWARSCTSKWIQGDPNQNFRFQMTVALSVCISDPMLVKPKCVWEAVVFYEFQLIVYTCKLLMPKMTAVYIKPAGIPLVIEI